MSGFEQIGHDYIQRQFNERRKGHDKHSGVHYPKGGNWRPDAGGSSVVKGKPRNPKPYLPMGMKLERPR
jgi:hypothetical protein